MMPQRRNHSETNTGVKETVAIALAAVGAELAQAWL